MRLFSAFSFILLFSKVSTKYFSFDKTVYSQFLEQSWFKFVIQLSKICLKETKKFVTGSQSVRMIIEALGKLSHCLSTVIQHRRNCTKVEALPEKGKSFILYHVVYLNFKNSCLIVGQQSSNKVF